MKNIKSILLTILCFVAVQNAIQAQTAFENEIKRFEDMLAHSVEPLGGEPFLQIDGNHACRVTYWFQNPKFKYTYEFYFSHLDSASIYLGGGMDIGILRVHAKEGKNIAMTKVAKKGSMKGKPEKTMIEEITFYLPDAEYNKRAKMVLKHLIKMSQKCLNDIDDYHEEPVEQNKSGELKP